MGGEKLGSCPSSLFSEVGRGTRREDVCACMCVCMWPVCIGLTLGEEGSGVCVNQEEEVRGRKGLGSLRAGRAVGANSTLGAFPAQRPCTGWLQAGFCDEGAWDGRLPAPGSRRR